METKFTKGEWKIINDSINLSVYDELPDNIEDVEYFESLMIDIKGSVPIKNIALIPTDHVSKEEATANAKLIAVAPFQYEKHNENILLCDKVLEYALSGDNIKMIETLSKIKSNSIDSIKKATE